MPVVLLSLSEESLSTTSPSSKVSSTLSPSAASLYLRPRFPRLLLRALGVGDFIVRRDGSLFLSGDRGLVADRYAVGGRDHVVDGALVDRDEHGAVKIGADVEYKHVLLIVDRLDDADETADGSDLGAGLDAVHHFLRLLLVSCVGG